MGSITLQGFGPKWRRAIKDERAEAAAFLQTSGEPWLCCQSAEFPRIPASGDLGFTPVGMGNADRDHPGMSSWWNREQQINQLRGGNSASSVLFTPKSRACCDGFYWAGTEFSLVSSHTQNITNILVVPTSALQ